MSDSFTDSFLDPSRFGGAISGETRALMTQMLDFEEPEVTPIPIDRGIQHGLTTSQPPSQVASAPPPPTPLIPASHLPSLAPLVGRLLEELESHPTRLLSLNPSRREAIALHLNRISGSPSPTGTTPTPGEFGNNLGLWIEGPRNPAQNSALRAYFEEVAAMTLGQTLVLKKWSDSGIRRWSMNDLGRLNWALSTALRPHVPLDREGWQITRPNLYSWFNPNERLQQEIWTALDSWKLTGESPLILSHLFNSIRKTPVENHEPQGYDARFFKHLWEQMPLFGFNSSVDNGPIKRNKIAFSPTLRDGALVRNAPAALQWVGLESSPFQFMMAELMQLWWGPAVPPVWSIGTGLEVHTRDQLSLALGSPKPSVLCRIAEMEACDLAIILEEQMVRSQGRNPNSARFKEQIEKLPYFKRLRAPGTSLGDLQACVAMSKLRPEGLLWWAREEALSAKDGRELLNFMLERAKLVREWDFSELEHSLPIGIPLFPKHIYLFQRETHLETRLSHRPVRHSVQGQLRSHVELPLVLEDAFQSAAGEVDSRGQWKILTHSSPSPQRDWAEKWPDPASQSIIRELDNLRTSSLPLANFTTVRSTPEGDSARNGEWSVPLSLRGFWLVGEYDSSEGRRLCVRTLPRPGQGSQGAGLMVLVPEESWVAPLCTFLRSGTVQKWLDHHAERRGDRWILNEQVIRWIPIPKQLLRAMGVPGAINDWEDRELAGVQLPDEIQALISEGSFNPKLLRESLGRLPENEKTTIQIHAQVFVQTAKALEYLTSGQNRLGSLVTNDGQIRWGQLLTILPKGECIPVTVHPRIRLTGSLPSHLSIHKMDRVKSPMPGVLFSTESGFTLHVGTDSNLLLNILWEQLQGLTHPTWSELLQYLRLPRKIDLAESTALDVLNSHAEQKAQIKELQDLLNACQLF